VGEAIVIGTKDMPVGSPIEIPGPPQKAQEFWLLRGKTIPNGIDTVFHLLMEKEGSFLLT
jgi:hypothetical protein